MLFIKRWWLRPLRHHGRRARIFYYHVPSAWTAFSAFLVNLVASLVYLVKRNPKVDALAMVSAEVGVVFCTVVLVTGPIWARPVWASGGPGTCADSTLYCGYLPQLSPFCAASPTVPKPRARGRGSLSLALSISPWSTFSIWFFRTQHPQPVIGGGVQSIPRVRVLPDQLEWHFCVLRF